VILLRNDKPAKQFGGANLRKFLPRHYVAYENAAVLTGSDTPALGSLEYLKSDVYEERCVWEAESAALSDSYFGRADCLILGNCTADYMTGTIGGASMGDTSISRALAPKETALDATDQNIAVMRLSGASINGGFSLTLRGIAPIELNAFYIGRLREWLPASEYAYSFEGRGQGKLTDYGVAYGARRPSRRALDCSWDSLSDVDRRVMERYMDSVQNVAPHFVIAHPETEFIPPLFAVLKNQSLANVKQKNSWAWSGAALNYIGVR
jgi:hypothetical protein